MKKIIALVMCAMLLVTFAACGEKNDDTAGKPDDGQKVVEGIPDNNDDNPDNQTEQPDDGSEATDKTDTDSGTTQKTDNNAKKPADFKGVTLVAVDSPFFVNGISYYNHIDKEYNRSGVAANMKVTVGGKEYTLEYDKSLETELDNVDIYENDWIECKVSVNSGKIRSLHFDDKKPALGGAAGSEEQLKESSKAFLSGYMTEDLSKYTFSCKTSYSKSGNSMSADSFYVPNTADEKLKSYSISFTKYIGNMRTADSIGLKVGSDGKVSFISYDAHNFDGCTADTAKIEALRTVAGEYARVVLDPEVIKLHSNNINSGYLTYISGKLCVSFTATVNVTYIPENDKSDMPLKITVPIDYKA